MTINLRVEEERLIRNMMDRCTVTRVIAEATVLRLALGPRNELLLEVIAGFQGVTVSRVKLRVAIGTNALRRHGFFDTSTDLLFRD